MATIRVKSANLLRRDTAENWKNKNPILRKGEQSLETDTGIMKIGDGTTEYNSLSDDNIYLPKSHIKKIEVDLTEYVKHTDIDQTYSPTSENAQSGKAVAKAISNIDIDISHINNTFANALKSTKTDKAVAISDMSPIEHDLKVKLSGEIEDFSSVEVSLFGKNLLEYPYIDTTKTVNGITFTDNGDGTITANGTATADAEFILQDTINAKTKYNPFNYLNNMKVQVTGSPSGFSKDTYYIYCIKTGDIGGAVWNADPTRYRFKIVVKAGQTVKDLVFKPTILLYDVGFDKTFEKYNRQIITASADGVIERIKSTANITILTNNTGVTVECEYNRDINKAFAELQQAVLSMGGNT